jgi:pimeloyl-ACP methyl ester carboxylesterase
MSRTLLLLHGYTGCSEDWRHVFAEPLPGFRVLAPDLPGHGKSINPRNTFRFADVARDIFAWLDDQGVDRVQAIGVSAGANTLLHMATQQPQRIEAMVHVSGTPRFPEQARVIMRAMGSEPSSQAQWAEMRARHKLGDDQIRALFTHGRGFADDLKDMNFNPALLSKITARTLIVHGDRDPLYPVELAVELLRGIPNASLWVVPKGGHGPIFGDQAAPFVEVVKKFF